MNLLGRLYKARAKKAPRKLKDIDVDEISLVDRTSSSKKFSVIKADVAEERRELREFFKSEELEALIKTDDEAGLQAAIDKALAILKPFIERSDMPKDFEDAVRLLAGLSAAAAGGDEAGSPGKDKAIYSDGDVEERLSTVNKSASSGFGALLSEIARVHCPRAYEKIFKQAEPGEGEAITLDDLAEIAEAHGLELRPRNARTVKKSLDGQNDDDDADEKPLWPSLA